MEFEHRVYRNRRCQVCFIDDLRGENGVAEGRPKAVRSHRAFGNDSLQRIHDPPAPRRQTFFLADRARDTNQRQQRLQLPDRPRFGQNGMRKVGVAPHPKRQRLT